MADRGVELLPHQQRFVEEYRSDTVPRAVTLTSAPGMGKSTALAAVVAERAARGEFVVLVVPGPLVEQWSDRLGALGGIEPASYRSPADFRMALGASPTLWPSRGVVVISSTILKSPLARKAVEKATPSLLVVDDIDASPETSTGSALASLASRASRVIATSVGGDIPWLGESETRAWRYPLIDKGGRAVRPLFTVQIREFPGDVDETDLVNDALRQLESLGHPFPAGLMSRPAIQGALLGFIRRIDAPEQLGLWAEGQLELDSDETWSRPIDPAVVGALWGLLDRFDDLAPDARLAATVAEVQAARADDRPVVVVTETIGELEYVTAGLGSIGDALAHVTGRHPLKERERAFETLAASAVLIATPILFSMQRELPSRTKSIWFTIPRDLQRARRQIGLGQSELEVVLLRADPPMTPADRLVERLAHDLRTYMEAGGTSGLSLDLDGTSPTD